MGRRNAICSVYGFTSFEWHIHASISPYSSHHPSTYLLLHGYCCIDTGTGISFIFLSLGQPVYLFVRNTKKVVMAVFLIENILLQLYSEKGIWELKDKFALSHELSFFSEDVTTKWKWKVEQLVQRLQRFGCVSVHWFIEVFLLEASELTV